MAKAISLESVVMGVTYIHPLENGILRVQRNYTLVGDDQPLFDAAGTFVLDASLEWANIPQNIKSALILIDDWTTAQAEDDVGL